MNKIKESYMEFLRSDEYDERTEEEIDHGLEKRKNEIAEKALEHFYGSKVWNEISERRA